MKLKFLYRGLAVVAACIVVLLLVDWAVGKNKEEDFSSVPVVDGDSEFSSTPTGTEDGKGESAEGSIETSSTASATSSKNNISSQNKVPSDTGGDDSVMTDEEFEEFIKNDSSLTGSIEVTLGNDKEDGKGKPPSSSTPDKSTNPDKNSETSSDTKVENSSSSPNLWDKDGDGYYDIKIY